MPVITVLGFAYGGGFKGLLLNRLVEEGFARAEVAPAENGARVTFAPERKGALARALARLFIKDLRVFELARLSGFLPREIRYSPEVISRAAELTRGEAWLPFAEAELAGYLNSGSLLVAEGFMRFRLQPALEDWALAVDTAGEELLFKAERDGLLRLLAAAAEAELAGFKARRVRLILFPDGSAVLTDPKDCRAELVSCGEGGLLGLLIGLAPQSIEVYDLTRGRGRGVVGSIRAVFGAKVGVFSDI